MKDAKALGNKLIVGVFTDEVAESFKRRPIMELAHRLKIIEHMKPVDKVVIQDELKPDKNLLKFKPHILAKGPGAGWEKGKIVPGEETIRKIGGEVIFLSYHDGISTSEIIKKIKEQK